MHQRVTTERIRRTTVGIGRVAYVALARFDGRHGYVTTGDGWANNSDGDTMRHTMLGQTTVTPIRDR